MGLLDSIMGGVGGLIDNTIGLPFQIVGNQMQQNQNQALTDQQLNANEALSEFNFQQQYDLWQKTNYPAQVQQLEKAGLNPALLYGKGGGGGTTTGAPSGGIGMGMATNPAQPGATSAAQAAQANAAQASAEQTQATTPQTADLMKAQIASLNQGVNNAKATEALTEAQTQLQKLDNSIKGETQDDQIATIRATAGMIENQMQREVRNNNMDAATMQDKIQTIHAIMIGQFVQNALTQANTNLTNTEVNEIVTKIQQDWKQLDINKQNANTQQGQLKLQQYIHNLPDKSRMAAEGLMKLIPSLSLPIF